MPSGPAFLFDLDGTLIDSVYQHVLAWREALESVGIELSVWRIHRRMGMSGGLFVNALLRETGRDLKPEQAAQIRRVHGEAYARQVSQVRPLPGARELLAYLTQAGVRSWREALESVGIELSVWRIHRRMGMSGGLFVNALLRETGRDLKPEQAAQIRRVHGEAYARQVSQVRPLPGARELLAYLTQAGV